jgi:hypothetical protein
MMLLHCISTLKIAVKSFVTLWHALAFGFVAVHHWHFQCCTGLALAGGFVAHSQRCGLTLAVKLGIGHF